MLERAQAALAERGGGLLARARNLIFGQNGQ
jgi:hypothetical protein